jgi:xanthine dehydrogenase accessory factor
MVTSMRNNRVLIHRYWVTGSWKHTIPHNYFQLIEEEVKSLLSSDKSVNPREMEFTSSGEKNSILFFLEPVFPHSHLVIAGAGHIGKALAHLGKLLDYEVTVIDDRAEYANRGNIPDADNIIVEDIGTAMLKLKKTTDTYIVIVTRGHKNDAKALKPCIGSDASYIGMFGSKNKIALMHRKFVQNGWATPKQLKEIHAPVGLEIQSETIQEIAVSIAAQLVLERNSKKHADV